MPAAFPQPGQTIGRFRLDRQLGVGGMGVVYEAWETTLDRRVALKVIAPGHGDDPEFRRRFGVEARALASLDSPHVTKVYAHGEDDGYLYIATQLVPDGDLAQLLTRTGAVALGPALDLLGQVAAGLADAHAAGLVHRDIKPGNVLLRKVPGEPTTQQAANQAAYQAYLGDFGIVRRVDAELSRVAGTVGTPSYMAPELNHGAPASVVTDVYALGCLLWTTLVGRPPYEGPTDIAVMAGHASRPVPQLAGGAPLLDVVNRVLRTAMAKDPADRYRTAVELRDDLVAAAAATDDPAHGGPALPATGETTTFRPAPDTPTNLLAPTTIRRDEPAPAAAAPSPPRRRRPWLVPAAAAAVLGVAIVAVLLVVVGRGDGDGGDDGGVELSAEEQAFVDLDGDEVVATTVRTMARLGSVNVVATPPDRDPPETFDLDATAEGTCTGEHRVGDGTGEVLVANPGPGTTQSYLRGDAAYWTNRSYKPAIVDKLVSGAWAGKWMFPFVEDDDELQRLCDLPGLLSAQVAGPGAATVDNREGDVVEVDGVPALTVQNVGDARDSELLVEAAAPHHLLRATTSDGWTYAYSDWDVVVDAQAPADRDLRFFDRLVDTVDDAG